jgi:hypothetical protein
MAGLGSPLAQGKGVGPDDARASVRAFGELQLFSPLGRFQRQKGLQLLLIQLNFLRPVTPKVAGSSPVAPASSISRLSCVAYFGCNFLAEISPGAWRGVVVDSS